MQRPALIAFLATATAMAAVSALYLLPGEQGRPAPGRAESPSGIGSGPLDGMTFAGAIGPQGEAKDVQDTFVFQNGRFVSTECEKQCNYPARPYFVRSSGSATEFVSETKCPYKDAKIVWRGTVDGNSINGVATWTVRRWYWTIESTFEFSGELALRATPLASAR